MTGRLHKSAQYSPEPVVSVLLFLSAFFSSFAISVGYQWVTPNFSCRLLALHVLPAITVPPLALLILLGSAVKASSASREP